MPLRLATFAILLITAAAVGMLAMRLSAPRPPPPAAKANVTAPVQEEKLASYLVAAHPLQPGTLARLDDFTLKTVPADKVPPDAILDSPNVGGELRGGLIRSYLEVGAPLTEDNLIHPRERGYLAAVLAPGTRAVSIAVDQVTGVAGLIWPGDRVDVILTQDMPQTQPGGTPLITSQTVLTDVRVIAVDQDITQGAPTYGTPVAGKVATTVTIQATSEQAERLAVATRLGHLSLAVRSVGDEPNSTATGTVSSNNLSSGLRSPEAPQGTRVQVIQGGQRGEVVFQ